MERKGQTGMERDMLNGIVALLLALADLAERAAGRSHPVRWLVLWYLRQAPAVAGDFIAGSSSHAAGRYWSPALAATPHGSDTADALHLAASLRALAVIVRDMAGRVFRLSFLRVGWTCGDKSRCGSSHDGFDAAMRGHGQAGFSPIEPCDSS